MADGARVSLEVRRPLGQRAARDGGAALRRPHRFVCITDDAKGIDGDVRVVPIWNDFAHLRGPNGVNCYRRLAGILRRGGRPHRAALRFAWTWTA